MAFLSSGGTVISFAEFQDVLDRDQRLFDANESLTEDVVEPLLVRATERILTRLRSTAWWQSYYVNRNSSVILSTVADIPALNVNRIKARLNDFTDLCVFSAMSEYILPLIADFSNEDSAERKKMGFYAQRTESLFNELVSAGDWYDFDADGVIESNEKDPGIYNLKRVR